MNTGVLQYAASFLCLAKGLKLLAESLYPEVETEPQSGSYVVEG
jgi:hypothetical protein